MIDINWIKEFGKEAQGKKELILFLEGKSLTRKQSDLAQCYMCSGYYLDGRVYCGLDKSCPKVGFMPYRKGGPQKSRIRKPLTNEHKAKMQAGRKRQN